MARIYLASSWRNNEQEAAVAILRKDGHEVYDFKNPGNDMGAFKWDKVDPDWKSWGPQRYRDLLINSAVAAGGFTSDSRAMRWADTCVLFLPCGASAHTEFGVMHGWGKRTFIVLSEQRFEPELMYLFADHICLGLDEVRELL